MCSRRKNCTCLFVLAVVSMLFAQCNPVNGQQGEVQTLEWNVFLKNWQLLGPFPVADAASSGLDTEFMQDEARLQAGQVGFYDDKLFAWIDHESGKIDFKKAFKVNGTAGNNLVAYAYTEVVSPAAQKVILAFAHDDGVAAWVNGVEIARADVHTAPVLDDTVAEVELKAGVNSVLMKISQGDQGWAAATRFRPPEHTEPLLTFRCKPSGTLTRLPTITVELLSADDRVMATYRANGGQKSWPGGGGGFYSVYAPAPEQKPAAVRFSTVDPGFAIDGELIPWASVQKGNFAVPLKSDRPLQLLVFDSATQEPIGRAQVWQGSIQSDPVTNQKGRVSLPDFSPVATQCWVSADGYVARRFPLKWPRQKLQRVPLTAGGKSLSGVITSASGEPLAGAIVQSRTYQQYSPSTVTNENGRFTFASLPADQTRLSPIVECRGYVTKDFRFEFGETLSGEVRWSLDPGAIIAGRVTHKSTGEPIEGVTLTTGEDRFGANDDAPETKTDADGRFELLGVAQGQSLLHAFSDGFAPDMQYVTASTGATTEVNFELLEGKPVTGVITDVDGKPIPQVWLVTDTWNGVRMFRREARSDAQGQFTLAHMPEDVTEVDVLKGGYISERNVKMKGGEVLYLTMKPEVTHVIAVRDIAGQLVPDLKINKGYLWEGNSSYSWSSSEWETSRYYDKLSGDMKIVIDEPINGQIAYRFRATGYRESIVKLPNDVSEGQRFDVQLQPATTFPGKVVDADTGNPLAGVAVALVSDNDRMRTDYYVQYQSPWKYLQGRSFTGPHTISGPDGSFRLSMPNESDSAGLVIVSESHGFCLITDIGEALADAHDQKRTLEFPLPASATLEGQVVIGGQPLAGSLVHVQWKPPGGSNNQRFGAGGQLTTDADGRFRYPNLGPGTYRLSRVFAYERPGGGGMSSYLGGEDVVLLPGQTVVRNIERPVGFQLAGVALDAEGNPLSNCVVSVRSTESNNEQIEGMLTDSLGKFDFQHLPAATYSLLAEHSKATGRYQSVLDYRGALELKLDQSVNDAVIDMTAIESNSDSRGYVARPASRLAGTLPPDFTATPLNSEESFTLSDQNGKVVVLAFWSTWSDNVDQFNDAFEEYGDDDNISFMTIFSGVNEDHVRSQMQDGGYRFPVLFSAFTDEDSVAAAFGAQSNAVTYVVGHDGRLASEPIASGQQHGTAIEAALTALTASTGAVADEPGRLKINLRRDGGQHGIPNAKLLMQVIDTQGNARHQDRFSINGVPQRLVWRHPKLNEGERLSVTLSAAGISDIEQSVADVSASGSITFDVKSPRLFSGRIVRQDDAKPAVGLKVQLQSPIAGIISGTTGDDGRFELPCFLGSHFLVSASNDELAVPFGGTNVVNVGIDSDPEFKELMASPAVSIQGLVVDAAGEPVPQAIVAASIAAAVQTDDDGRFELSGIASTGKTQVWAYRSSSYGAIRVSSPESDSEHKIVLGQGLGSEVAEADATTISGKAPVLSVQSLEGIQTEWSLTDAKDHLLVFCPLWHPDSRALIDRSLEWANENDAVVNVMSLDWSIEQTRRELQKSSIDAPVFYAGPGQLQLNADWNMQKLPASVVVTKDGQLQSSPLD